MRACFSTRQFDLGQGPATGGAVRAARNGIAREVGFDPWRAVVLRQVHGVQVLEVGPEGGRGAFFGAASGLREADAATTTAPGVALVALGADCLPVLAWRSNGTRVAAAHAGWRGIVGGVIDTTLASLGGSMRDVHVAIGPGIGPCCYRVDGDLRSRFASRFGSDVVIVDAVDLGLAAERAVIAAGVPIGSVTRSVACTSCDSERFFSYRRDGADAGRQGGFIWIVDDHGSA